MYEVMYGYDGEWEEIVFRVGDRADVDEKCDRVLKMAVPFSRGWPGVPHDVGNVGKSRLCHGKDIVSKTFLFSLQALIIPAVGDA